MSGCTLGIGACAGVVLYKAFDLCEKVYFARLAKQGWSKVWSKIKSRPGVRIVAGWLDLIPDEFPERLGPFALEEVPMLAALYSTDRHSPNEGVWGIAKERLQRECGVEANAYVRLPLGCQHDIAFGVARRRRLDIPREAKTMRWVFPHAETNVYKKRNSAVRHEKTVTVVGHHGVEDQSATVYFLQVGGWMFFDEHNEALSLMTVVPTSAEERDSVGFQRPQKWNPKWTQSMLEKGMFHAPSLRPWTEAGCKFFCWMAPNLKIDGCEEQPQVPYGGFAYLFHDPRSGSPTLGSSTPLGGTAEKSSWFCGGPLLAAGVHKQTMDCYFPVADFIGFPVDRD